MTAPLDLPAIRARLAAQKPDPLLLSRVTQHAFRAGFSAALSRIDLTAGAIDLWVNYEPDELDYSRMQAVLGNAADTRALLAENEALREAGQAVVDRWDTPLWKDATHTKEFIEDLRAALTGGKDG